MGRAEGVSDPGADVGSFYGEVWRTRERQGDTRGYAIVLVVFLTCCFIWRVSLGIGTIRCFSANTCMYQVSVYVHVRFFDL
jgi:hypothetical protein